MSIVTKDGVEAVVGMKVYYYLYQGTVGDDGVLPNRISEVTITEQHVRNAAGYLIERVSHFYADKKAAIREAIACWEDVVESAEDQIARYQAMLGSNEPNGPKQLVTSVQRILE